MIKLSSELIKIQNSILTEENLGKSIILLKNLLSRKKTDFHKHTNPIDSKYVLLLDKLLKIETDYDRMLEFSYNELKDENKDSIYVKLLGEVYKVFLELTLADRLETHEIFASAYMNASVVDNSVEIIFANLEKYVQEMALESLPLAKGGKSENIKQFHNDYMDKLFDSIFVSCNWSKEYSENIGKIILSPTIDKNDALLLVSAVSFSAFNILDVNKIILLINIYQYSADLYLKQRALVGWVFALPKIDSVIFSDLKNYILSLCLDKKIRKDILNLQKQVFYCLNVDRDTKILNKTIIPSLMKGNVNNFGIIEKEDHLIDEILGSDEKDKELEEIEESFQKMQDMQQSGSDIYFGGFSKMKSFPFFRKISNWFLPFSIFNPELSKQSDILKSNKLFQVILEKAPLCDSDKYSFAFSLTKILDQFPKEFDVFSTDIDSFKDSYAMNIDQSTETYIRRIYLQNLYRFFRLYYCHDEFYNPFDYNINKHENFFFLNPIFEHSFVEEASVLKKFLNKEAQYTYLEILNDYYFDSTDIESLLYKAKILMKKEQYSMAQNIYQAILEKNEDNIYAIKGMAQASFYCEDFENAENYYSILHKKYPTEINYAINFSISQMNNYHPSKAVSLLYELNYNHPENMNVLRALGWGLMLIKKKEAAIKIYEKLLENNKIQAVDYLHTGYAYWINDRIKLAVEKFNLYLELTKIENASPRNYLEHTFYSDYKFLNNLGIKKIDVNLMIDLTFKHS